MGGALSRKGGSMPPEAPAPIDIIFPPHVGPAWWVLLYAVLIASGLAIWMIVEWLSETPPKRPPWKRW